MRKSFAIILFLISALLTLVALYLFVVIGATACMDFFKDPNALKAGTFFAALVSLLGPLTLAGILAYYGIKYIKPKIKKA